MHSEMRRALLAKLHKTPLVHWLLVHLGAPILYGAFRLLCLTLRYRRVGSIPDVLARLNAGGRCVGAFFHGDALLMADEMRRRSGFGDFVIMVSKSRDGDILARFLRLAGARVSRGSSSRGGARALLDMCRALGPRDFAGLAVDGPRGPRHAVKEGALLLAGRTGRWVQPVAAIPDKKWTARSWDRMEIPIPFSRVTFVYGEPLEVPKDAGRERIEALRLRLEEQLKEMKNEKPAVRQSP